MDLKTLLTDYNIPFQEGGLHRHVRGGWLGTNCPYCGPNNQKFHLGFNLKSFACVCWRCGTHNSIEALALLTGQDAAAVRGKVKGLDFVARTYAKPTTGRYKPPKDFGPLGAPHKRYLEQRGMDPEEIESIWGIGGIGISAHLQWRLFIPIHQNWEPVSWTTRAIGANHPMRYVSASPAEEAVHHKELLYGADLANNAIVICEGPTDAWRIGPGAVATLGAKYTTAQIRKMASYAVRVVCLDAEEGVQRKARQLARELSCFPGTTHNIVLETGKDPGEAEDWEVQKIREEFL